MAYLLIAYGGGVGGYLLMAYLLIRFEEAEEEAEEAEEERD